MSDRPPYAPDPILPISMECRTCDKEIELGGMSRHIFDNHFGPSQEPDPKRD